MPNINSIELLFNIDSVELFNNCIGVAQERHDLE